MTEKEVANQITKEEAAKMIKQIESEDYKGYHSAVMANMLQTFFVSMPEQDLSNVELEPGEADKILSTPFHSDDFE